MLPNATIKWFTLFYLTVSIALFQCRASESNPPQNDFAEIVRSKLGADYQVDKNSDNSFALCQQKRSVNDHARRKLKFVVVRLRDNMITKEGAFVPGYAKWIANDLIEVATSEGVSDEATIKKISVRSEDQ